MKLSRFLALFALVVAGFDYAAVAFASTDREHASPAEVVEKVRSAVRLLEEYGGAGLTVLRGSGSGYVWKDTYVFVVNCDADVVLSNPAFPEREDGDIKQHTDYNGKRYGPELCAKASEPGGGWIEYVWPRPGGNGARRKISFVMSVPDHPYQVGAGLYSETLTLDELSALTQ